MPNAPSFTPLEFERLTLDEQRARAEAMLAEHKRRRSVRHFSPESVPMEVLRRCVEVACTAPSGANKQPWTFCVVTDPSLKQEIRLAAEREERAFYGGRASQRWLEDLQPFGTDEHKPFLEVAPALIVVFAQNRGARGDKHYYVQESVGIAVGFLLSALHRCGLVTLTHTPSPMGFLKEILARPDNERAYLLIPVGYPVQGCEVPAIERKLTDEVLSVYAGDEEGT